MWAVVLVLSFFLNDWLDLMGLWNWVRIFRCCAMRSDLSLTKSVNFTGELYKCQKSYKIGSIVRFYFCSIHNILYYDFNVSCEHILCQILCHLSWEKESCWASIQKINLSCSKRNFLYVACPIEIFSL